jgi:hypothetical protein
MDKDFPQDAARGCQDFEFRLIGSRFNQRLADRDVIAF